MRSFVGLALGILAVILTAPSVRAEQSPLFRVVGDWAIAVDQHLDNGCFAVATYEGGTGVRIGFDMIDQFLYFMIGDDDWKSIEVGKKYAVEIYFGDETPWSADAVGYSFDGKDTDVFLWSRIGGIASDQAALFMKEFMEENGVDLWYNGQSIANLTLKGSFKAGQALLECQQLFLPSGPSGDPFSRPAPNDDPFRQRTRPGSDPFA